MITNLNGHDRMEVSILTVAVRKKLNYYLLL